MLLPARHHSRLLRVLVCVVASTATPALYSAPAGGHGQADAAGGPRFVDALAQAERKGDYRALLTDCDQQVDAHPEDREAYRRRALVRWGAREYDGALADFNRAIGLARRQQAPARLVAIMIYGRAIIRREQHDTAAEAAELARAVRTDRSFTDPLNDLAWIRATNPDAALRNGREAVALARRACVTVPGSVKYLDTLAAAYAEAGDAQRAAETEKVAIKAARLDAKTTGEYNNFLDEAPGRADLYAGGERYREAALSSR